MIQPCRTFSWPTGNMSSVLYGRAPANIHSWVARFFADSWMKFSRLGICAGRLKDLSQAIVNQPEVEKWLSFSTRIREVSPLRSPGPAIGYCWVAQER